jgi:hypothetical protein
MYCGAPFNVKDRASEWSELTNPCGAAHDLTARHDSRPKKGKRANKPDSETAWSISADDLTSVLLLPETISGATGFRRGVQNWFRTDS